jgi:hypothetical protein
MQYIVSFTEYKVSLQQKDQPSFRYVREIIAMYFDNIRRKTLYGKNEKF